MLIQYLWHKQLRIEWELGGVLSPPPYQKKIFNTMHSIHISHFKGGVGNQKCIFQLVTIFIYIFCTKFKENSCKEFFHYVNSYVCITMYMIMLSRYTLFSKQSQQKPAFCLKGGFLSSRNTKMFALYSMEYFLCANRNEQLCLLPRSYFLHF